MLPERPAPCCVTGAGGAGEAEGRRAWGTALVSGRPRVSCCFLGGGGGGWRAAGAAERDLASSSCASFSATTWRSASPPPSKSAAAEVGRDRSCSVQGTTPGRFNDVRGKPAGSLLVDQHIEHSALPAGQMLAQDITEAEGRLDFLAVIIIEAVLSTQLE